MPRTNRKPEIIKELASGITPPVIAEKYSVTPSYVYHLDKVRRESFKTKSAPASTDKKPDIKSNRLPTGDSFEQLSISSIRRYGGDIAEEYLRELQGQYGVQMYKEMGNHPICAAVIQAVKMTLRRVQWFAVAPKSGREQEVDFVNSLMDDMSLTWNDFIDQALSMLQFGFSPMEQVYKLRKGNDIRPGPKTVESRYKDGKIGWRKFSLIGQDTLAPGNSWNFDNNTGDLLGLNQMPPQGFIPYNIKRLPVYIPIEKIVLFRTTAFKNNPEGYSILRPMFRCVTEDTEILTKNGWKTIDEIRIGESIATLNPNTNEIQYQPARDVPKYNYDGEMVYAHSRFIDQMVTPNHRMWVRRAHKDNYEFVNAEDCNPTVSFKATADWNAPDYETIRVGSYDIDADLWFEFLGWWLSEGSSGKYGRAYSTTITQQKKQHIPRIREIVNSLPWNVCEKVDKRDGKITWEFSRKELWEHLNYLGKSKNRFMPEYVLRASARQLSILLDAYWKGDGTLAGNPNKWEGTKIIYTASRAMADDLMECILKAGGRPSLRWQEPTGFANDGIWVVTMGMEFKSMWATWDVVPYQGRVWCVTTDNGIIYIRRNGICSWTGNSYYYATNLEEVEAISAERMGSGFPVFYLGDDISKADDGTSEINEYRKIARNLRVDEQAGLVIPHPKMGGGAREGTGVLLEFASPERGSTINFTNMIERHEKRMAMVGLAQFIHLGMSNSSGGQGAALAEVTTDFFQLAVSAWADSIRDTINRSALFPLLRLNKMNLEEPIIIEHSAVGSPDLKVVADYINKTVGAKVIEPDDQLENSLRRLAGMPEKDYATTRSVMLEVNGDGGTRTDRQGKTEVGVKQPNDSQKPANNQRNQNPRAEKPQEPTKPEARKPMRASEETRYDVELMALTKRAAKFMSEKENNNG